MHTASLRPAPLRPGDAVAIISPSGPILEEHLTPGLALLERWGLRPRLGHSVLARHQPGYLAGADALRAADLAWALSAPEVSAVWCARGGYGAMRLLEGLSALPLTPKLLIGFSDVTALHLHLNQRGLCTLHGPVIKSLRLHLDEDPAQTLPALHDALFGARQAPTLTGLRCVRAGVARGPVYGGNLTLIASLLASSHCPDLRGAILAIEDIGESDYRIDRLLYSVALSAQGRQLAGLVLGDFTDCGGVYAPQEAIDALVAQLAHEALPCPIVSGAPLGHGARNVPLPLGVWATLDAGAGSLRFDHDAVAS